MKKIKIFSIAVALMLGMGGAGAQTTGSVDNTFCFLDANGNEVKDGSTVTYYYSEPEYKVEDMPIFGSWIEAKFDLYVKNNTTEEPVVAAHIVTEEMPTGRLNFCFPNECPPSVPADYTTDSRIVLAGERLSLNSEWIVAEAEAGTGIELETKDYGNARFTLQLLVMNGTAVKAYGPKITINCVYADPTGIEDVAASCKNATEVARYDANGRKLSAPVEGLNIVKLSDGRTVKIRN